MKSSQKSWFSLCGIFMLTTTIRIENTPAKSDPEALDAVNVNLSLDTPAVIEAGEPIVVRYKIVNMLEDQTIGVYTGMHKTAWYSLDLKDNSGISTVIRNEQPPASGGLQPSETSTLRPQGYESGYIVASRFLSAPHPGKYVLTIHVAMRYASVDPTEHNSFVIKHTVDASGASFTKDYTFPLTITQANPAQLTSRAEGLLQQIRKEQDNAKLTALYDALFSMPEAQAGPSWEALATKPPRMYEEKIANGLARIHSVKTVDLLVQMLENPSLPPDNAFYIKTKIDESYNAGDASVKEHIKALAASRGGTMPEKVSIPVPGD